jgi:hypothetical protein
MHEPPPTPVIQRSAKHYRASLYLLALTAIHALLMTSSHAASPSANPTKASAELATLGGGCFWCVEAVFERIDGVNTVVSGYAGGHSNNPTYEEVCRGATGHAEVVQINFDPEKISYDQILEIFWEAHDPTTPIDREQTSAANTGPSSFTITTPKNRLRKIRNAPPPPDSNARS